MTAVLKPIQPLPQLPVRPRDVVTEPGGARAGSLQSGAAPYPSALSYPPRLDAAGASGYLRAVWAIRRTVGTLAKLRCVGGGPAFQRIGRSIVYRRADLDAWVVEQTRETPRE